MVIRLIYVINSRLPFNSLDNFIVSIVNFVLFILRTVYMIPFIILFLLGINPSLQTVKM
jgi:hypothetical protein